MGRAPCCDKMGLKKGPWAPEEDKILVDYIKKNGHGNWRALPKQSGLLRCGKSCRLRWTNYLRPDLKRGNFSLEEEDTIINLHKILGNRWSAIASRLPGRTDNEIKNVWNTHLKKRLIRMGIDPRTHTAAKFSSSSASSLVECSPRSLQYSDRCERPPQDTDSSFASLVCNTSTDSKPAVSTDNLATVSRHNQAFLTQQNTSANSPSTLSDLSSSFYDSSNDLFSSMSSIDTEIIGAVESSLTSDVMQCNNSINSFDVGTIGHDQGSQITEDQNKDVDFLIDETFMWGNHSLGDGEKWLPRQQIQCEPEIAKTEVKGEQSSTLQADYSMSVDTKDDLFSEIQSPNLFSEPRSSMMDASGTILHQLWNMDVQTDDSIDYWLNVLGKVGPLPPFSQFSSLSQALLF